MSTDLFLSASGLDAATLARAVRETLAARLPSAEFLPIIPLGTALGVHGGPGCIVVAALTPLVKEVFEISRFNLVFDLFDSVEAAARTHGSSAK